jgi:hypothetical protein
VYLTDLVTAGFDIEAETPEAAADEVRELATDDGEFIEAETAEIEVRISEDIPGQLADPVYVWRPEKKEGESDG